MNQLYTGGLTSPYDPRDFHYAPVARGTFDWETGFDIEDKTGKITTKDQGKSSSCGGQAWAYYGEVLEKIATGDYEPRSAKWIYSHTNVPPGGGSRGRDNNDFVIKQGWVRESIVPSYDNGEKPTEAFITAHVTPTREVIEDAEVNKALSYLQVSHSKIDMVAQAIQDNNGVILMVGGEDNGTWRSKFPKPPENGYDWLHWLYAGKVKLIDGKKYIGVKNSWGDKTGDKGWQWLSEDYFLSGNIIEAWTLAWDYKPAKHKLLLIELVKVLTEFVKLLKK